MLRELFSSCAAVARESFGNQERFANVENKSSGDALVALLIVIVLLALVLIFGKYLWNNVACKYITIIKPVKNVIELLAIIVLLDLVLPSCTCLPK
jgi:hypothetical protein